jgi:SAM-dependent methyltransferase
MRGRLRRLAGRAGLESHLHESFDEAWERSRGRWRRARPDADLTWGAQVTGEAFIEKAAANGAFGPGKAVLEVGPGYGRLLETAIERGEEFGSWTGIDLSDANVRHLTAKFERDGVRFLQADVESVRLEAPADTVLSSLTFKHLFPSFNRGLANLASQMSPGGVAIFDLIEGERRYFEADGVTYIRWYTRGEVRDLVNRSGLEVTSFDEVRHHPAMTRLLVVAQKPG